MEPKPAFIQDLAIWDPVSAYGILLGIPRVPFAMNIRGTFSSFALPQNPVIGDLNIDGTIAQRTWIEKIDYTVYQPNVFAGNVFKTLYDAMLKQSPGIDVRMSVRSGPRYVVSPQFTPLENFGQLFATRWPAGWQLFKQQSIQVELQLSQPQPIIAPNGPPYNVTLTFIGWQFLDHTIDEIGADYARERLRAAGIWTPDVAACRE